MAEHPEWLARRLATAPRSPGCYLMKARDGEVVYVGKAKDLKARLSQYFAPNPGDTRFFVGLLDRVLGEIELIALPSDKEALLVENELIKRHQPRFNVKLKDDKNFLMIRLGKEHPWPRLEVVRRRKRDDADYFGPYDSASAIRRTLRVVNRHFQLRTCTDTELKNRSRPCLEHQIGRCPAPCVLDVAPDEYTESIKDVRLFLQGRSVDLLARLRAKMERAAAELSFELAAHYRDQIAAIERSLAPQTVRLGHDTDIDTVGMAREGAVVVLQVLTLRSGALLGSRAYPLKPTELPDDEVIDDFLAAYYSGSRPVPDLVLVPEATTDAEAWSELLTELRNKKVRLYHPQRGEKRRLLDVADDNARETLRARTRSAEEAADTLQQLQDRLGLASFPRRIECYDISHVQGAETVASMAVAVDGALATSEYRHFKITSISGPDDFAAMYEVLSRRFARARSRPDDDGESPDLVLIDGGKGQLNVAAAVLADLGVTSVELASIAKSRVVAAGRDGTSAPSSEDVERSEERIFRPGRKNHVPLRRNSNALFLLQRLRDEAHRFAITHHKKRRRKRTLTSELDSVEGIGPARRRALLRHFGSMKAIRAASAAELTACEGISAVMAERLREALGQRD